MLFLSHKVSRTLSNQSSAITRMQNLASMFSSSVKPSVVKFYTEVDENGYLSNFYKAPIKIDGLIWPTPEHYF